jgi:hypothetical protein
LRTALELQGAEAAQLLAAELQHVSAERQLLMVGDYGISPWGSLPK